MSDRDALLRAIIENPADDAPRLVYADWLDEHGDPDRAEFIRLTIRPEQSRTVAARRREWELLARNGEKWRSEAPALPDVTWSYDFRRGFIHQAYLPSWTAFVVLRDQLFRAVPLDDLAIGQVTGPACRLIASEPRLRRLQTLIVSGSFSDDGLIALAACPHLCNLRTLYLGGIWRGARSITDNGGRALVESPALANLRRLHAAGYAFSEKLKADLRARFPEAIV